LREIQSKLCLAVQGVKRLFVCFLPHIDFAENKWCNLRRICGDCRIFRYL